MAQRVVLTDEGPACPRCGSQTFWTKSVLAFGRAPQRCSGCGVGLLPAKGRAVRKKKKSDAGPKPVRASAPRTQRHSHEWRDVSGPDDQRNGIRVYECACGKGRTESA